MSSGSIEQERLTSGLLSPRSGPNSCARTRKSHTPRAARTGRTIKIGLERSSYSPPTRTRVNDDPKQKAERDRNDDGNAKQISNAINHLSPDPTGNLLVAHLSYFELTPSIRL